MKRYSQQQIKALLDKFMDGQTTVEEEAQLANYFRTHDVPAEWEDYRVMFDYFDHGMQGDLLPVQDPQTSFTRQMGRYWWGVAAAAVIAGIIVSTLLLQHPQSTAQPPKPPAIVQKVDSTTIQPAVVTESQQLASATPASPVRSTRVHPATPARRLKAENKRLAEENERLQRELADLKRRAFIIDMESMGYKAVKNEDGGIVFIDLEQELENELNNQPTTNIPAL